MPKGGRAYTLKCVNVTTQITNLESNHDQQVLGIGILVGVILISPAVTIMVKNNFSTIQVCYLING